MIDLGVILCGGKATRLPNKPLLPYVDQNGRIKPLICSSVDYLLAAGHTQMILLDQKDSILPTILPCIYPGVTFVQVVDGFKGIPFALKMVAELTSEAEVRYMVVCADNLYPFDEVLDPKEEECAVVRDVGHEDSKHLSRFVNTPDATLWVKRHDVRGSQLGLTTPWYLTKRGLMHVTDETDIVDYLNAQGIEAWSRPRAGWCDLGTPETFTEYWAHIYAKTEQARQPAGPPSAASVLQGLVQRLGPQEHQVR
jgi:hypothetical protein